MIVQAIDDPSTALQQRMVCFSSDTSVEAIWAVADYFLARPRPQCCTRGGRHGTLQSKPHPEQGYRACLGLLAAAHENVRSPTYYH